MAVDKPSGLLVIPSPKKETRTLNSILNEDLKERGVAYRLHPCHRIDRETSGVVLYAKGKSVQQKVLREFQEHKITKRYIAFVHGLPARREGQISFSIEGKRAVTRYKIIEQRSNYSVMEVMPVTGRTNQIRIHFKELGHPLVGETKFAFRKDFTLRFKRVCLHAQEIGLQHPMTHAPLQISIPLAQDLQKFLVSHA